MNAHENDASEIVSQAAASSSAQSAGVDVESESSSTSCTEEDEEESSDEENFTPPSKVMWLRRSGVSVPTCVPKYSNQKIAEVSEQWRQMKEEEEEEEA